MVSQPAEALHQAFGAHLLQISHDFRPVQAPARRRENIGGLSFPAAKLGTVDAVKGGLLTVRHHDPVPERLRSLIGRNEEILAPAGAGQPSFLPQRMNNMVRGFRSYAENGYHFGAIELAAPLFREGQDDPALLSRQ